jgi:hypothetical protein
VRNPDASPREAVLGLWTAWAEDCGIELLVAGAEQRRCGRRSGPRSQEMLFAPGPNGGRAGLGQVNQERALGTLNVRRDWLG